MAARLHRAERRHGCILAAVSASAVADLGNPNEIGKVFTCFQRYLYAKAAAYVRCGTRVGVFQSSEGL
jgi:hypothetical protein